MFWKIATVLAVAFNISSCVTDQNSEDPIGFGRADCQSIHASPMLQQQFELDKSVCLPRAQAAAIAGTAAMPAGRGLGGAIASGIDQGIAQAQISNATVMSCMAERGYLWKRRSDYMASCRPIIAQREEAEAEALKAEETSNKRSNKTQKSLSSL